VIEDAHKVVKDCIEVAAKESGYILASGCDIPENSSVENVRNFFEAGRKYGRYNA